MLCNLIDLQKSYLKHFLLPVFLILLLFVVGCGGGGGSKADNAAVKDLKDNSQKNLDENIRVIAQYGVSPSSNVVNSDFSFTAVIQNKDSKSASLSTKQNVFGFILDSFGSKVKTIMLLDDGKYGDKEPNDNVFGSLFQMQKEGIFGVGICIGDKEDNCKVIEGEPFGYQKFEVGNVKNNINVIDKPYCGAIGSKSEGWYDKSGLIRLDNCAKCDVKCDAIATKSEGWYSSCDGKLIKNGECSQDKMDAIEQAIKNKLS